MDEQTWQSCREPQRMLDWLHSSEAAAAERKLRLFAVACCNGCFLHRLLDPRSRTAVDVAARLVEGQTDTAEVARAASAASEVHEARHGIAYDAYDALAAEVAALTLTDPITAAMLSAAVASHREQHLWQAADLLRDLFGPLPFRPVRFDPTWRTPTVRALAERAYLERQVPAATLDASLLRVLADAVEETGCDNEQLLAHLRSPGPHVRGCWPVDLLLEKV